MQSGPGEITKVLQRMRSGDSAAKSELASMVYEELRRLARAHMRREAPGHLLQPSALVNEAFIRLLAQDDGFENRGHFFALASSLMRRILVDHARNHLAAKRGGNVIHVDFTFAETRAGLSMRSEEMLSLDDALSRLSQLDERQCRVVEMRFFGGMKDQEIASALGVTVRTVLRDWTSARAWLHAELTSPTEFSK